MPVGAKTFMQFQSYRGFFQVLIVGAAIIILCGAVAAQSGRRLPKGSPPVATPTPAPTPETVAQTKVPPKPDFVLKVYSDIIQSGPSAFPLPTRMHTWAVERLRRSRLLDVRDSGSVTRREAIKQAKLETEIYVVLLELQSDPFGRGGGGSANESWIELTIYNPVTGKVKASRRLTMNESSTRLPGSRTVLQTCNPGVYGDDVLLLEASIEAADFVMDSFRVPLPPLCSGPGT